MKRVIIRYHEDIKEQISNISGASFVELFRQYGIVTIPDDSVETLNHISYIDDIQDSSELFYDLEQAKKDTCLTELFSPFYEEDASDYASVSARDSLSGAGVFIGIIDSGIDWNNSIFWREDGSCKIAYIWDQTKTETSYREEGGLSFFSPAGYDGGIEITGKQLEQIRAEKNESGNFVSNILNVSGEHGTKVASIATTFAPESQLIIVKVAKNDQGFPETAFAMEAVDYLIRKSLENDMPIVINLSFGNNQGPHDGSTLFERYISEVSEIGKNLIVIAAGNEGDSNHHQMVQLFDREQYSEIVLDTRGQKITLSIWFSMVDIIEIMLISPEGSRYNIRESSDINRFNIKKINSNPGSLLNGILIEWDGSEKAGVWQVLFQPVAIKNGRIDMWLPTVEKIGKSTYFPRAVAEGSVTIPGTARGGLCVGAYSGLQMQVASFSGRGLTTDGRLVPEIVAPGVNLSVKNEMGGYDTISGTSFATPIVAGIAALLMQWGVCVIH